MRIGNSGARTQILEAMRKEAPWLKILTTAVQRMRNAGDAHDARAALSRVDPLSEDEVRRIPDGDFVSASFDIESKQSPSRTVVLLSTPRSGSTYLCELLHRADFCTAHEYFQPTQYLPLLAHRWGCVDQGRVSWLRYARALERHRTSSAGVLGINVHGKHLRRFDEASTYFCSPDIDFLWLQRRDKLRQAVSYSIARQTGQWSSLFRSRAVARYDRSLILKSLRAIHEDEDLIAAYLHARGMSCSTIYYEDVVRAPDAILRSALGIELGENVGNEIAVRPQGGPRNDAWLSLLGRDMFFGRHDNERSAPKAVVRASERRLSRAVPRTNARARKVLIVSPVPTHPANRGNRARVGALVESLRDFGHDIHFMHVARDLEHVETMRKVWGSRYTPVQMQRPGSHAATLTRRIGRKVGVDAAYRYGLDEWYDPVVDEATDELNARIRFDTVVVEYVFLSRALLRFGDDVLKVIDTHDAFTNRHRHYLNHRQRPKWYSCTSRAEARGLDRSDVVLAIQEDEAEYFRSLTTREVVTIGHSVPLSPPSNNDVVPGRMVAIGSENAINTRSLGWFIEQVLPQIRRELPHAELAVAGRVCGTLGSAPGVRLLGRLEDLGAAYASASVAINPTLFGTGLKIKTVEALGYGRALVTTPCGAAGLSSGVQSAFLVESDPEAFAARVVDLLVDDEQARALGQSAYRFAQRYNEGTQADLFTLFGGEAVLPHPRARNAPWDSRKAACS